MTEGALRRRIYERMERKVNSDLLKIARRFITVEID
jgi:hypothetical protein